MVVLNAHYSVLWGQGQFLQQLDLKIKNKTGTTILIQH